jgi:lysylphosphatidylglycerol synthetase-like protein (DUF2156 family)
MAKNGSRPGGVTFIATLCAVFGIVELATGVLSLAFLGTVADQTSLDATEVFWSSVALVALGLAYLLVSGGLYRGKDVARVIVLLVTLLHAVNGLWLAVSGQLVPGLVTIAVALVISALLWTGRGGAYFDRDIRGRRR